MDQRRHLHKGNVGICTQRRCSYECLMSYKFFIELLIVTTCASIQLKNYIGSNGKDNKH